MSCPASTLNKASPRITPSTPGTPGMPELTGTLTLGFAAAVGVMVINLFAAQPLTGPVSAALGLPPAWRGLVAMLPQLGYATGLLLAGVRGHAGGGGSGLVGHGLLPGGICRWRRHLRDPDAGAAGRADGTARAARARGGQCDERTDAGHPAVAPAGQPAGRRGRMAGLLRRAGGAGRLAGSRAAALAAKPQAGRRPSLCQPDRLDVAIAAQPAGAAPACLDRGAVDGRLQRLLDRGGPAAGAAAVRARQPRRGAVRAGRRGRRGGGASGRPPGRSGPWPCRHRGIATGRAGCVVAGRRGCRWLVRLCGRSAPHAGDWPAGDRRHGAGCRRDRRPDLRPARDQPAGRGRARAPQRLVRGDLLRRWRGGRAGGRRRLGAWRLAGGVPGRARLCRAQPDGARPHAAKPCGADGGLAPDGLVT
ncbi:major facilitator transporter [Cupriavidus basilensis OR16]|uniref:Major facilitator transporter n=1 Tax=Cupriavidus basilensis OR16 TaxID=1127483 RepID=H1S4C2_9BURK|nr:major facilitator transporter [Cupriavidus basilensis OR16]